MPKITQIRHDQYINRYCVDVDEEFCLRIRARTFSAMNLHVGQEISCDELKRMEKYHWKIVYQHTWEGAKIRQDRVKTLLESINQDIIVKVIGFGADSTQLIEAHPEQPGKPDLEVLTRGSHQSTIMFVEVSGTEMKRGSDYWIRPDKLEYCRSHPDENVWIILHYAEPEEQFVFVRPDNSQDYPHVMKTIRDSDEFYVIFDESSPEVVTRNEFATELNALVDQRKKEENQ